MRGASRASLAALGDQLAAEDITSATVALRLGNELFSVVGCECSGFVVTLVMAWSPARRFNAG